MLSTNGWLAGLINKTFLFWLCVCHGERPNERFEPFIRIIAKYSTFGCKRVRLKRFAIRILDSIDLIVRTLLPDTSGRLRTKNKNKMKAISTKYPLSVNNTKSEKMKPLVLHSLDTFFYNDIQSQHTYLELE